GGATTIQGVLNSAPSTTFRIEFFDNTVADPSGNGEGRTFIGSINVTTGSVGSSVFFTSPPFLSVTSGRITATATRLAAGSPTDTSEFSTAVCSLVVTNTSDSGLGSLREAINCANSQPNIDRTGDNVPDPDVITFNIPGSVVHTISPITVLPTI